MTRTKDEGLADSQVEDLKARVELNDKESPALAVCIHQNSYPQESVRGPQIFILRTRRRQRKQRGNADRAEKFRSGACQRLRKYYILYAKIQSHHIVIVEWIFKQPGGGGC